MKRTVLRAVDANRKPMVGQEPGIADLRGYLEPRPATYAQLVSGARIAQEWDRVVFEGQEAWTRWPIFARVTRGGKVDDNFEAVCHVSQDTADGPWRAFVFGADLGESFMTPDEARTAADERAVDHYKWSLLGGGR